MLKPVEACKLVGGPIYHHSPRVFKLFCCRQRCKPIAFFMKSSLILTYGNFKQIGAQTTVTKMKRTSRNSKQDIRLPSSAIVHGHVSDANAGTGLSWQSLVEPVGTWRSGNIFSNSLLEQLNLTKDTTDYLWYSTRYVCINALYFQPTSFVSLGILEVNHRKRINPNLDTSFSFLETISKRFWLK